MATTIETRRRAGMEKRGEGSSRSYQARAAMGRALFFAAAALGCGEQSVSGFLPDLVIVSLTPTFTTIMPGQTLRFAATAYQTVNGARVERAITWSVRDTLIATISQTGVLTASYPGITVVTAASDLGPVAQSSIVVSALPSARRIRLGSADDARTALTGPSYLLNGNARPLPDATAALITHLGGGPLDIVVIAASSAESSSVTAECDVMMTVRAVNSCETITITNAAEADDPYVRGAINRAEFVYFAGSDQCRYAGWVGSPTQTAVRALVARGGAVGGGGAGLSIMGEYVHDGCAGSPTSATALRDPWAPGISFTTGLFAWTPLTTLITDSHFVARDRMGRLLAFVTRQMVERAVPVVWGLGVDEGAAVLIDKSGDGTVFGGPAFVVRSPTRARATPGSPLDASDFRILRLDPGSRWSFVARPLSAFWSRDVRDGVLQGSAYSP